MVYGLNKKSDESSFITASLRKKEKKASSSKAEIETSFL
jgi:hypothetical protein